MDADTRHQLKQNDLAEALSKLRDFSDRRTIASVIVILAIALAYAGYRFWAWRHEAQLVQSYQTLTSVDAGDTSKGDAPLATLRRLIADNAEPELVAMARLQLARGLAARGLDPAGAARLTEAENEYARVLDMPVAPTIFKAPAMYQLGIIHETKRDFARAREMYTLLSQDPRFEGSPFVEQAAARLEQLDELAVPIEFEPGVRPLPTTQPTRELAPVQPTAQSIGDRIKITPKPTTPPAASPGATEEAPTESSEPQQP